MDQTCSFAGCSGKRKQIVQTSNSRLRQINLSRINGTVIKNDTTVSVVPKGSKDSFELPFEISLFISLSAVSAGYAN